MLSRFRFFAFKKSNFSGVISAGELSITEKTSAGLI